MTTTVHAVQQHTGAPWTNDTTGQPVRAGVAVDTVTATPNGRPAKVRLTVGSNAAVIYLDATQATALAAAITAAAAG